MNTEGISIQNNFLDVQDFDSIYSTFFDRTFPWYFNDHVIDKNDKGLDHFQFTHLFYGGNQIWSQHYNMLHPIIEKIDPLSIVMIKANLLTRTDKNIEHGLHMDFNDPKITTCVYYINTNNGYTIFENGDTFYSQANTLISFSSQLSHSGATCTDQKTRIVLNINYIEKTLDRKSIND